jgi:hypothetical protein
VATRSRRYVDATVAARVTAQRFVRRSGGILSLAANVRTVRM